MPRDAARITLGVGDPAANPLRDRALADGIPAARRGPMAARAATSRSNPFTTAIQGLAASGDAACLIDLEGTILFVNDAWERFGAENGGGKRCSAGDLVGSRIQDHVSGEEPRRVLRTLLRRALRRGPRQGGRPAVQTSECNGPDVARLVMTQLAPVIAGSEALGLTLVHRVVRELPAGEVYPLVDGGDRDYHAGDGVLEQCSCCRRTRRPSEPAEWDFVPGLVAAPPVDARFAYCPLCRELHYAADTAEEALAGAG
jgi:hypothetical protein